MVSSGVMCVCSPGFTPNIPPTHILDEWSYSWRQGKETTLHKHRKTSFKSLFLMIDDCSKGIKGHSYYFFAFFILIVILDSFWGLN